MNFVTIPLTRTARYEIMGKKPGRRHPATLWRNFKARRQVRRLADLDDHTLEDIGVTRTEIAWAARLPLSVNAAVLMYQRAAARRQAALNRPLLRS